MELGLPSHRPVALAARPPCAPSSAHLSQVSVREAAQVILEGTDTNCVLVPVGAKVRSQHGEKDPTIHCTGLPPEALLVSLGQGPQYPTQPPQDPAAARRPLVCLVAGAASAPSEQRPGPAMGPLVSVPLGRLPCLWRLNRWLTD